MTAPALPRREPVVEVLVVAGPRRGHILRIDRETARNGLLVLPEREPLTAGFRLDDPVDLRTMVLPYREVQYDVWHGRRSGWCAAPR